MAAPLSEIREPSASHLFYQAHGRRPRIARAEGIYAWDISGKRYIDASSGPIVSNIGHSNPRVLAAMKLQMDRATFAYRLHFENDAAEELASLTASLMPDGLDRIFFTSGGSESVETCLKLARQYAIAIGEPERYKIVSMTPSYHGATLGCVAVTGMELFVEPFRAMIREMPKISAPTYYLDRDGLSQEERGLRYAEELRDKIIAEGPESVLAFIMEPIGGASTGALVAPDGWYARIQQICREFGVLLIADEVMTGAGRTGRFLGIEHWQLDADIIGMAKGFAAGYAPLGAVAARGSIVDAVMADGGFAHGYTYAGNPLACSAGNAVLKEVLANGLIDNAAARGLYLKSRLGELMERFPFIGDVRGKGLLLAFEFVADRETMEPLPVELNAYLELVEEAYRRGLIIYARRTRGGFRGDHFMVCPPLIVTNEEIDEIMEILVASIEAFAAAKGLER
ncbi:MAG: aspartate aminotransferase family protein [Gammaproteobacteria bacterium]|nr:aspartate aminotransferase family protein [Gammaproteobacteria bacterium]MDH3578542.1 aspartate aminotransferase family protein [Gammaproteobacteria bacterium]